MLFSTQSTRSSHASAAEQSYQDNLRLMQNARVAAVAARQEASAAFWAKVSGVVGSAVRAVATAISAWATGQHASVRLGAGHQTHHTGA
jgi:formylmethanofuran dehydrogenase subunit E-like metal-binding protein